MCSLRSIPFEAWHAEVLHDRLQPVQMGDAAMYDYGTFMGIAEHPGITITQDAKILGSGGVVMIWPGRAFGWAWFSRDVTARQMTFIHRRSTALIVDLQKDRRYNRIETTVVYDHVAGHRWAQMLGFMPEGDMRAYDVEGRDHTLYARVASHGHSSNHRGSRGGRVRRKRFCEFPPEPIPGEDRGA